MDWQELCPPLKRRDDEEESFSAPFVLDEEDPSCFMRTEVHQGSRPGDVRISRIGPTHHVFRRLDMGVLEATSEAEEPRSRLELVIRAAKQVLIGTPLATVRAEHERLTKFQALAILSSDAISSVAYATEAILITLVAAGSANLWLTSFICLAIVMLLSVVALSYHQTIPAYPNGGGSYIVAKENLGTLPGLVAAASLMIDYILTVSVSIAAGVQALATLFPSLAPDVVLIDIAFVVVITIVNLRGVRESGSIFALPTYLFIGSALLLILFGCIKVFLFEHQPLFGHFQYVRPIVPLSAFLILRSFADGCSAMTGTEAISNGIPVFRKPETRNAAMTLTWMAGILGTLFIGITMLALAYGTEANPTGNPTVIGQIAQLVFTGPLFFMYPVFQFATLFILTLAANTSYADFPRLSSLLARDHFLPHQFAFRGDRLAFSTGILCLAILSSLLLIVFKGKTTLLINLYAVGVFLSFTLSQTGMIRHWWRQRKAHQAWRRSIVINGIGACTTLLVALIIMTTKFLEGAWIVVLLIPLLTLFFLGIRRHYLLVERERMTVSPLSPKDIHHHVLVPIAHLNQASLQSLAYARSISPSVTAVSVNCNQQQMETLCRRWNAWQATLKQDERIPLDVITCSHCSLVRSLLDYMHRRQRLCPGEVITVLLPESVKSGIIRHLFAHPISFLLKMALFFQPEIVVTDVPWQRQKRLAAVYPQEIRHRFIIPIAELDQATLFSLAYAHSISLHVSAVHVALDTQDVEEMRDQWENLQRRLTKEEQTQLVTIASPYRSLLHPLLAYLDTLRELHPQETLTVILPECIVSHWWEYFLHHQTALQLKAALLAQPHIVVTNVSHHLHKKARPWIW